MTTVGEGQPSCTAFGLGLDPTITISSLFIAFGLIVGFGLLRLLSHLPKRVQPIYPPSKRYCLIQHYVIHTLDFGSNLVYLLSNYYANGGLFYASIVLLVVMPVLCFLYRLWEIGGRLVVIIEDHRGVDHACHVLQRVISAVIVFPMGVLLFWLKLDALEVCWNFFFKVWNPEFCVTGYSEGDNSGVFERSLNVEDANDSPRFYIDTAVLNGTLIMHLLFELIPQMVIQILNNSLLEKWTVIAVASVVFSIIPLAGTLHSLYQKWVNGVSSRDLPQGLFPLGGLGWVGCTLGIALWNGLTALLRGVTGGADNSLGYLDITHFDVLKAQKLQTSAPVDANDDIEDKDSSHIGNQSHPEQFIANVRSQSVDVLDACSMVIVTTQFNLDSMLFRNSSRNVTITNSNLKEDMPISSLMSMSSSDNGAHREFEGSLTIDGDTEGSIFLTNSPPSNEGLETSLANRSAHHARQNVMSFQDEIAIVECAELAAADHSASVAARSDYASDKFDHVSGTYTLHTQDQSHSEEFAEAVEADEMIADSIFAVTEEAIASELDDFKHMDVI